MYAAGATERFDWRRSFGKNAKHISWSFRIYTWNQKFRKLKFSMKNSKPQIILTRTRLTRILTRNSKVEIYRTTVLWLKINFLTILCITLCSSGGRCYFLFRKIPRGWIREKRLFRYLRGQRSRVNRGNSIGIETTASHHRRSQAETQRERFFAMQLDYICLRVWFLK